MGLVKITETGEAELPPVALLVPILAQGDASRAGGRAELETKGSPSSSGDVSVACSDPCAWSSTCPSPSHNLMPGALSQPLARLFWPQGVHWGSWEDSEWDEKALSNSLSFLLLKVAEITPFLCKRLPQLCWVLYRNTPLLCFSLTCTVSETCNLMTGLIRYNCHLC